MARDTPGGTLTEIQTPLGIEPIITVEVDWDGQVVAYSDKDLTNAQGKILSVGGLDAVIKLGATGSGGEVTVTISDTDGSIKDLLNTIDVHKRPAEVYQGFEGLADRIPLLQGQVSSPITWDEGERTVTFTIENVIESKQLGFSPEEGEFDFIAESAIGVAWPLCFGDVVRVPAVKITEAVRGTSLTRYGQITLPELDQLCQLAVSLQQAITAKRLADGNAGFSDANYAVVIDNYSGATIALNNFLGNLIFDSPTQEAKLLTYIDICQELERWRVFYDQELAKYIDAERRIQILDSTPGKASVTGFKFFGSKINTNSDNFYGLISENFNFDSQVASSYRVGVNVPSFPIVLRPGVPATTGLVEQAQEAYDDYFAENWPYTSPEQWAQDAALQATIAQAQQDLNAALGDSSSALSNLTLANINIIGLIDQKLVQEDLLLEFVLTSITVEGGENFPQSPTEVEIIIQGLHYKGTFSGRIFTINEANTPANTNISVTAGDRINEFVLSDPTISLKGKYCRFANGIVFVENQSGGVCSFSPLLFRRSGVTGPLLGVLINGGPVQRDVYDPLQISGTILETSVFLSFEWLNLLRSSSFPDYAVGLSQVRQRDYGFEIGDDVFLVNNLEDTYIANLIPSTAIHEVMAYRVIDGERRLMPVPSRFFTIDLNETIAGQNATTIRFSRPLRSLFGEQWEDQLYVSLTSSEGPNTADIIEFLANTYTDLTPDAASFGDVNSAIDAFPSNFALLERSETLGTIEQIAWQARCAAYVKGDTLYLKYLAVEETPVETIDEGSIDFRTLQVTLTPTEDLVTEFVANWDSDYSAERRNKIILRNNIGKYGTITREFDFFIYNIQSLVIKSATFWLIRYSNTWKVAKFTTPLNMLKLESFDTVSLDLSQNFIASSPVLGMVEGVTYDSANYNLEFEVMTSVRAGFLTPYIFVWPAGVSISEIYPTLDDNFAGGASA